MLCRVDLMHPQSLHAAQLAALAMEEPLSPRHAAPGHDAPASTALQQTCGVSGELGTALLVIDLQADFLPG